MHLTSVLRYGVDEPHDGTNERQQVRTNERAPRSLRHLHQLVGNRSLVLSEPARFITLPRPYRRERRFGQIRPPQVQRSARPVLRRTPATLRGPPLGSRVLRHSRCNAGFHNRLIAPPHGTSDLDPRAAEVEQLMPGTFDQLNRPVPAAASVCYQVNTTVLLPLVDASIANVGRDDVGFGSATARVIKATDGAWPRAYQFFATSMPERARALNRPGFLSEVLHLSRAGTGWTARVGIVPSNREAKREEAEKGLDRDESRQLYIVGDGFTDRAGSTNLTIDLDLEGRWPTGAGTAWSPVPATCRGSL